MLVFEQGSEKSNDCVQKSAINQSSSEELLDDKHSQLLIQAPPPAHEVVLTVYEDGTYKLASVLDSGTLFSEFSSGGLGEEGGMFGCVVKQFLHLMLKACE